MTELSVSYILSRNEIGFLIDCFPSVEATDVGRILQVRFREQLSEISSAMDGLIYKKLAQNEAGRITFHPVALLLAENCLRAIEVLYLVESESGLHAYIIKAERLWILIEDYPMEPDAVRITPVPGEKAMADLISKKTYTSVEAWNSVETKINMKHGVMDIE